jgi:hypothetical protein
MDAAFAFVEASPAGGSFVFTVGGRASVADGAVAECGEGVFFLMESCTCSRVQAAMGLLFTM